MKKKKNNKTESETETHCSWFKQTTKDVEKISAKQKKKSKKGKKGKVNTSILLLPEYPCQKETHSKAF